MEELNKNLKEEDQKQLNSRGLYELKKKQKEEARKKAIRKVALGEAPRKIGRYLLYGLITALIIGGLGWFISSRPNLPPTSMQNHTEDMPQVHTTEAPIPDRMQRHMLEHADGKGKAGIIIQYNCKDYACEPDMIQNLKTLVEKYPENVYLAPNSYDGKIILTKLGKQKILEEFNEQIIKDFIE